MTAKPPGYRCSGCDSSWSMAELQAGGFRSCCPERCMTTTKERAEKALGSWMSAALSDPNVCDAMKADIAAWFAAIEEAA